MTSLSTLSTLIQAPIPFDEISDRHECRLAAKSYLDQVGLPHSKLENWKYLDIDALLSQRLGEMTPGTLQSISGYNGEGAVSTISLGCDSSPLSYLNTAYFLNPIDIVIDHDASAPIVIDFSPSRWCCSRFNIRVASGVSATLFIQTSGTDSEFENRFIDIELADNSTLFCVQADHHVTGQQFFSMNVSLQQHASFNYVGFVTGVGLGRRDVQVDFYGEKAFASLQGIGLHRNQDQFFNHLTINHHVGNCECKQLFKSILMDNALTEFSGLVFVEKKAHGTNSAQLNQTLLLSDQARALSRPQLRIDADDVECAHGATVGQLNPDEIFYIQSRGMTAQQAKQLLTYGFAEEVLADVPDPQIKTALLELLQSEVAAYAIC